MIKLICLYVLLTSFKLWNQIKYICRHLLILWKACYLGEKKNLHQASPYINALSTKCTTVSIYRNNIKPSIDPKKIEEESFYHHGQIIMKKNLGKTGNIMKCEIYFPPCFESLHPFLLSRREASPLEERLRVSGIEGVFIVQSAPGPQLSSHVVYICFYFSLTWNWEIKIKIKGKIVVQGSYRSVWSLIY